MSMPSEERIEQELENKDYLIRKTVRWKRIHPHGEGDGELCVFCWKDLRASLEGRDEGFHEEESGDWICFPCLEAFLDAFDWKIIWPIGMYQTGPDEIPVF
ncbi:MAG: hypothetical protein J1E00_08020 [Oscillospiraceae bacterium]|nr:hypothetical protein [Oscillospiraceae bacterium]